MNAFNYVTPQSHNPDEILKRVTETFNMIKDYEVDVLINVNVKFLKMPDRQAKIFYKQPDKIFVESEFISPVIPVGKDTLSTSKVKIIVEGK